MYCNADYGGLLPPDSQIWLHLISEVSGTVCSFVWAEKLFDGIQMTAAFAPRRREKKPTRCHGGNFPHPSYPPPNPAPQRFFFFMRILFLFISFIFPLKNSMVWCFGEQVHLVLLNFLISSLQRDKLLSLSLPCGFYHNAVLFAENISL